MRDLWGERLRHRIDAERIADMFMPVQCSHCKGVYDVGRVEVTARYTDCSMWKAPCCGLTVDDRGAGWKSRPDYVELRRYRRGAAGEERNRL